MTAPARTRVDAHIHLTRYWEDLPGTAYRPDLVYTVPSLLGEMDAAGVEYAVAIPDEHVPNVAATIEEGRTLLAESKGRLKLVSTIDPRIGEAEIGAALERWSNTPELVAIKLFPGYIPFYPHDTRLDPVYEFASRRKLPVMIHQGDTLARDGVLKFARPIEVDEVAVRWRDIQFVLCHLGNPWIDEAAELVYKNPNVWTDCSGLLPKPTARHFRELFDRVRSLLLGVVLTVGDADRVLYGSDWPLESIATAVELVATLPIPEEDREKILGGNAHRLYRLS